MKAINKIMGAVLALGALAAATPALAEYPERPVRVVVTTVPGPLDAFARVVVKQVSEKLKQPFIVDNRAGAGGNVGADIVAKAPADGYTILFALDTTLTVNPSLYDKMPFDVNKDLAIISVPVTYSQMLAVGPNVKANSLADLVQLAKTQKMSYASGGNGSPSHLTMAAFLATAGLDMTHVPYKGTGASVVDVMGGQVDSVFAVVSGIWPQAKAGKLKPLAVSGNVRSPSAPDVPTVAELGYPGFNASFAYVIAAPANTPKEILQLLTREVQAAMASKEVQDLDHQADYSPTGLSPEASATWIRDMRKRWSEVITKAKISAN
ncbi:tripartite tricarboxylate transporter substrate binding protein [Ramlibacter sp. G-1-2-2]|uniref:Tripartite tricarboxylate transporter substrate binding protein n=1 Tax=Ramlibacter agri TaxID=2728837 RepID=A0A848H664_9BURK|nr:tripartite tricarboxylate transporter substrate binding protein [Ramlibacter agri]